VARVGLQLHQKNPGVFFLFHEPFSMRIYTHRKPQNARYDQLENVPFHILVGVCGVVERKLRSFWSSARTFFVSHDRRRLMIVAPLRLDIASSIINGVGSASIVDIVPLQANQSFGANQK
jgi:hypothetical protein